MTKQILLNNLHIVPIFQKEAFAFIEMHHRHHRRHVGSVFQIAVSDGEKIVGVAVVGRPVSRLLQDGFTLEVWRVTKNLGYRKLQTYILKSEPGTSLKASGWRLIGVRGGKSWNVKSRPRIDKHPLQKKILYEII